VVKTTKRVRVPCHRNTYKSYTVKVPRQVNERVPRTVNYTDYETKCKQVPYTAMRSEQRVRVENQPYQVPVQKCVTKMVSVTRKVPRTIYVDVTTQVPKQESQTVMETRTRAVKIPYTVQVPETRYRSEQYQAPVQKSKVVFDNVSKTVYDTQVRTRCEPKVTFVTKEIPVYNVVARPAQPCPPGMPCGADAGAAGGAAMGAASGAAMGASMGASMGDAAMGGVAVGGAAMSGAAMSGAAMGDASMASASMGGVSMAGASMGGVAMNGGGMAMGGGMGGYGGASAGGGYNGGASAAVNVSSQYRQEFNSIDTNNDGMISAQEYAAARQGPSGSAPQPPMCG